MTPTQAQIEAALKDMLTFFGKPLRSEWMNEQAWKEAKQVCANAQAALTAAAEVPEQEHIPQKSDQKPGLLPSGNTAAEVGERDSELDDITIRFQLERIKTLEAELVATIERCAQVAEWFSNVEKFTAEDVAARIRALKE